MFLIYVILINNMSKFFFISFVFRIKREKIMTMARRDIKREPRREEKALKAAQLEKVTLCFVCMLLPHFSSLRFSL